MKVNIEIDLNDFYNEFEGLGEWLQTWVKDELKKEIKKSPEWKDFVKTQIDKAVDGV